VEEDIANSPMFNVLCTLQWHSQDLDWWGARGSWRVRCGEGCPLPTVGGFCEWGTSQKILCFFSRLYLSSSQGIDTVVILPSVWLSRTDAMQSLFSTQHCRSSLSICLFAYLSLYLSVRHLSRMYCGWGEMVSHRGSVMVPLDRVLATSYRLSIVTMSPSAAVWPQFSMESF